MLRRFPWLQAGALQKVPKEEFHDVDSGYAWVRMSFRKQFHWNQDAHCFTKLQTEASGRQLPSCTSIRVKDLCSLCSTAWGLHWGVQNPAWALARAGEKRAWAGCCASFHPLAQEADKKTIDSEAGVYLATVQVTYPDRTWIEHLASSMKFSQRKWGIVRFWLGNGSMASIVSVFVYLSLFVNYLSNMTSLRLLNPQHLEAVKKVVVPEERPQKPSALPMHRDVRWRSLCFHLDLVQILI